MLIEKNIHGGWVISEVIDNRLMTRTYYDYTKKEAIREFKAEQYNNKKGAVNHEYFRKS
jgi:hypothetical protein